MGRGLGRSRDETPPRSQTLLPSRWKGKVGQTGDLGEWSGGTTGGDVGSEVMAGPAREPGGLSGTGAGEELGRPCGQGPAWPCSAAAPATGSVWNGKKEVQVSVGQVERLLDTRPKSGGLGLLTSPHRVTSGHSWSPHPDSGSSPERQNSPISLLWTELFPQKFISGSLNPPRWWYLEMGPLGSH